MKIVFYKHETTYEILPAITFTKFPITDGWSLMFSWLNFTFEIIK